MLRRVAAFRALSGLQAAATVPRLPSAALSAVSAHWQVAPPAHTLSTAAPSTSPVLDDGDSEALRALLQVAVHADDGKTSDTAGVAGTETGDAGTGTELAPPSADEAVAIMSVANKRLNGDTKDGFECLKPREIVQELDKFIIGQENAKKAISVALRNRWRRLHLPEELQSEIIPKNILMVGPTGVGKTEIARRLAKLAKAPFVKVEATKFTEVGYHGRDVDTIIRDLLEASMSLTKELKTEQYRAEVQPMVQRRILEAMTGPEAREDTIASFKRLLENGEMDDNEILIDIPVTPAGPPQFEMNVQGSSIDLGEILRLNTPKNSVRMEKKKLKVKDCWPILMDYELEKKLSTIDLRKEAIERAEQHGIVVIDEIDKIVTHTHKYSGDASSEGVQRDLLPLIEGCTVDVKRFGQVKTDYMLFVCSGAFHEAKPSDMLAELQGRLPIRVQLNPLTVEDLRRILIEPEANLLMQQKALIGAEDVNVDFDDECISQIAELAAEVNSTVENIGARRLHSIIERTMEDISFEAPDMAPGSVVTIDAEMVRQKVATLLQTADLRKFIL